MPGPRRILLAAALSALVLGGARLGCRALAGLETRRIVAETGRAIEALDAELPPELRTRLRDGLAGARDLAEADRLSPIARDTLRNRAEAVLADGRLAPREAEHLLRLLADLPTWDDARDALKYMGQR